MTKSCALCSFLALLTVLCVPPALLLFWVWGSSPKGLVGSFLYYTVFPGHFRTAAIVILLGPLVIVPAYVLAFLGCHKRRDVLDHVDGAAG